MRTSTGPVIKQEGFTNVSWFSRSIRLKQPFPTILCSIKIITWQQKEFGHVFYRIYDNISITLRCCCCAGGWAGCVFCWAGGGGAGSGRRGWGGLARVGPAANTRGLRLMSPHWHVGDLLLIACCCVIVMAVRYLQGPRNWMTCFWIILTEFSSFTHLCYLWMECHS